MRLLLLLLLLLLLFFEQLLLLLLLETAVEGKKIRKYIHKMVMQS